jgi:hypothetical protein
MGLSCEAGFDNIYGCTIAPGSMRTDEAGHAVKSMRS